jgi:hypothetical protein
MTDIAQTKPLQLYPHFASPRVHIAQYHLPRNYSGVDYRKHIQKTSSSVAKTALLPIMSNYMGNFVVPAFEWENPEKAQLDMHNFMKNIGQLAFENARDIGAEFYEVHTASANIPYHRVYDQGVISRFFSLKPDVTVLKPTAMFFVLR